MKGIYPYTESQKKLCAPAAERNKQAILEVLLQYIPQMTAAKSSVECLEVASGTGQHVAHFAQNLPGTQWQPAEFDTNDFPSIMAYASEVGNISEPVFIDASLSPEQWPLQGRIFDVVYCANMIHISPKACTPGLFAGASAYLLKGGILFTYGPYAHGGAITPESNRSFDQSLRSRDAEWGLRDIDDLKKIASNVGLVLEKIHDMPANNKTLVWRKI